MHRDLYECSGRLSPLGTLRLSRPRSWHRGQQNGNRLRRIVKSTYTLPAASVTALEFVSGWVSRSFQVYMSMKMDKSLQARRRANALEASQHRPRLRSTHMQCPRRASKSSRVTFDKPSPSPIHFLRARAHQAGTGLRGQHLTRSRHGRVHVGRPAIPLRPQEQQIRSKQPSADRGSRATCTSLNSRTPIRVVEHHVPALLPLALVEESSDGVYAGESVTESITW